MAPRSASRWRLAVALLAVGTALLAVLMAGNRLWLPAWLQPVGVLLYRVAYLAVLPVHVVVGAVSPPVEFHWPTLNWVASSYLTPPLLWALLHGYLRIRPRTRISALLWARLRRRSRPAPSPSSAAANGSREAPSRRQVLAGAAWGAAWTAGAGAGVYAVAIEPSLLRVRRYDVAIRGLPRALEGLRLVHISDTHYGPFVSRPFLESAIDRANELGPDLALLTGDYIHRSPERIEPGIGIFAGLRPRIGTLAVLGNHDHWEGARACREAFRKIGIPLVDNARRFVTPEGLTADAPRAGVPALCIAGIGDYWEGEVSFADALGGVPASTPRILLSHNPDAAERVPGDMRVDLMMCGHTHGGQIRLPLLGTPLVPSAYGAKYAGGMCRGPHCDVLVSRGVGLTILPLRFRVPPEIGLVTLRCAPPARTAGAGADSDH